MSFGEDVAETCDDAQRGDETAAVAFLRGLALGGPALPMVHDAETRQAIAALDSTIDTDATTAVWAHGDAAWGNLLVDGGRLGAVIDFRTSGVGDPSCDLAIAWTLFGESREAFRAVLRLDDATRARGRGRTPWKALITLTQHVNTNPAEAVTAQRVIEEVFADHEPAPRT